MSDLTRTSCEDLAGWLAERLPLFGGCTELAMALGEGFVRENAAGDLRVTFQLFVWQVDEKGAKASIIDIREQEVYVVPAPCRDEPARLRAFLDAWAALMPEVLASLDASANLMPHEIVLFSPLLLVRAETVDDFRRALRVKSRYGRFLGVGPRRARRPC